MPKQEVLGEEGQQAPDNGAGSVAIDSGVSDEEQQLFGDTSEEKASAKQPKDLEGEDELSLDKVKAHPVVVDLQSKFDRTTNVNQYLQEQLNQSLAVIKQLRGSETKAILEQIGDSPETRNLLQRLEGLDEREARLNILERQLLPLQKVEVCNAIIKDFEIPEEYRADLMETNDAKEMELKARTIQSVMAKLPKTQSKSANSAKARIPAISHVPDKAQGSVQPQTFEQVEQAYIDGKISFSQYKEAAKKAGVSIE